MERDNVAQEIADCYQSVYLQNNICLFWKGDFFMNIQMVFDEEVLKFILKNNLLERCRELINLSEVLPSLIEDQEVMEVLAKGKPCFLWSCSSEVSLGVVFEIHKTDDTYRITIYDLVPLD